jgi:hypothetical protein
MESTEVLTYVAIFLLLCILGLQLYNQFKDKFSDILDAKNCENSQIRDVEECKDTINAISKNISCNAQGQPANRGVSCSDGVESGSFANPNVINPVQEIVGIEDNSKLNKKDYFQNNDLNGYLNDFDV